MEYFLMVIGAIFVNNILLAQFLGNCPFMGVSKKMDTAIGMAAAVAAILTMAAMIAWVVEHYLLVPLDLQYLRTMAFILVIAALVQLVEMFLKKSVPTLYQALGIFLPLITTNCAVLGVAILNIDKEHNFWQALIFSFASAVGFGLALVMFAGIREKSEFSPVPRPLQGTATALVTAGIMSLVFFAFKGMI